MSKFTDSVHDSTPRLVVMFRRDGDKETFQWGILGAMPIMTLIGFIARVQIKLLDPWDADHYCPESALVLTWDDELKQSAWYIHPSLPVDSTVGFLETVKQTIVGSHMARQAAAQQVPIFGPDGRPMRR